jgi:hypothetical protein
MQTLTNLRKALEANDKCVFTCKDHTYKDGEKTGKGLRYWPNRGEKIIYDASGGSIDYDTILCAASVDANGDRVFYNKNARYRLGENQIAVRKRESGDTADQITWKEVDGEIVAQTTQGKNVARFEDADHLANPSERDIEAYREVNAEGVWVVNDGSRKYKYDELEELKKEWQDLYMPFIPENEFPRMPEEKDFSFIVFPDEGNDRYDGPMLYEKGELEPLFAENEGLTMGATSSQKERESDRHSTEQNPEAQKDDPNQEEKQNTGKEDRTCDYCGEETAFSPVDESDNLSCDNCGFTPGEQATEDQSENQEGETKKRNSSQTEEESPRSPKAENQPQEESEPSTEAESQPESAPEKTKENSVKEHQQNQDGGGDATDLL